MSKMIENNRIISIENNDTGETSKLLHQLVKKNKWMIAILGIFFILLIIVLSVLLFYFALRKNDENICLTKNCAATASVLIDAVDPTVDPCENFQKFACANFMRKHPVDEDKKNFASWEAFDTSFDLQMKNLFGSLNADGQPDVIVHMQKTYQICMNTTHQSEKEFEAFKNFTQEFLQWPLADGKNWQRKFLTLTDLFVESLGKVKLPNPLFFINYQKDKNDSKLAVSIRSRSISIFVSEEDIPDLKKEMHIEQQKAELGLLLELVQNYGNNDSESINQDIKDLKDLTTYEKQWKPSTNETPSEEMSIEELTNLSNYTINWLDFINAVVRSENYTFLPNDTVKIPNPDVLLRTIDICKRFPFRVINNIISWKVIFPFLIHKAGPIAAKLLEKHLATMPYYEHMKPKKVWSDCLDFLQHFYPLPVMRVFVDKYINRNDKTSANEMIQWLQKAYRAEISESTWVDEETKKNAILKADNIKRFVGYPDIIFDDKALNAEYSQMLPVQSSHFLNYVYLNKAIKEKARDLSSKAEKWILAPLKINARYDHHDNSIWFPVRVLQLPLFDADRLAAVNFGVMGSLIGHEIGHAFDDSGSDYDEKGDLRDWWTNETRTLFNEKSRCFIEQYNEYCPEELQGDENDTFCINGQQTLGENLADYTGVLSAFSAYKMWVKEHGREKRLPGLQEYSPEQIFFISYAFGWCENILPDYIVNKYNDDTHSPPYYRIIGPLSNSKDFRDTFNCPEGPMNRGKDSCTMW